MRLIHDTLVKGNRKDQKGKMEGFYEIQGIKNIVEE